MSTESPTEKSPRKKPGPRRGLPQPSKKPEHVRERERQVIEFIRAGLDLDSIAERLGYADHSAIVRIRDRVCKRHTVENLQDVRAIEVERLDALMQSIWPKARKGDMWAIDRILHIMERRSRYLGLDHADGLMERQVTLQEQQGELLVAVVKAALSKVTLTSEQVSEVVAAIATEARAIGAG